MESILIIFVLILLFLTNRKLGKLTLFLEGRNDYEEERDKQNKEQYFNFQNWLYKDIKIISDKITELHEVQTIDNPAWGENSAASKKKENLITLYSKYLVESEKMSQKDALIKSRFIINNFEEGVIDDIVRDEYFNDKTESEGKLLMSDSFRKEVEEKSKSLQEKDIFEPLWIGIVKRGYKKGDELIQNTRKSFEAHSGSYGYDCYVKDAALIFKLNQLGILGLKEKDGYSMQESKDRQKLGVSYNATDSEIKISYLELAKKYHPDSIDGNLEKFTEVNKAYKNLTDKDKTQKTMSGHKFFVLKEDDIEKIRDTVFTENREEGEYYDETHFEDRYSDKDFDMPFHQKFEFN